MVFGVIILELRKQANMSQSQFAHYTGVSIRTIQQWEQNRRVPPEYVVNLIERVLKADSIIKRL